MEKAVVDLLKPGHLTEAAAYWEGKPDDLKLIREVENFVYDFRPQGRELILRLTHSSHRTPDQVRGELEWMAHLHSHGVNVARPIASFNERFVETIPARGSKFIATAFERAPGASTTQREPEIWNADLFREWGRTIGRMHSATKSYVVSDSTIKRDEWYQEDMIVNAIRYLPPSEGGALLDLAECVNWLGGLPQSPDCYGLVHTDIHQGNFFYHDGRIIVFDFDDACYHWFAYDLAIPIYYALLAFPVEAKEEQTQFMRDFFPPFIQGYSEENALNPIWIDQLPKFLLFRDRVLHSFCFKKFDIANLSEPEQRFVDRMRASVGVEEPFGHLDFSF